MTRKIHPAAELAAYKIGLLKSPSALEDADRYLRLAAEFENFKKRAARQYADIIRSANEDLILEVLGVLDDFHRALDSLDASDDRGGAEGTDSVLAGMKLIRDKFIALLNGRGVVSMDAMGKAFDPVYHEAVMQSPSAEKEGTVIGIVSPGYTMNGKVIRPARVVVASSKNG